MNRFSSLIKLYPEDSKTDLERKNSWIWDEGIRVKSYWTTKMACITPKFYYSVVFLKHEPQILCYYSHEEVSLFALNLSILITALMKIMLCFSSEARSEKVIQLCLTLLEWLLSKSLSWTLPLRTQHHHARNPRHIERPYTGTSICSHN